MSNRTLFILFLLMFIPIGYVEYNIKSEKDTIKPKIESPIKPNNPVLPEQPKEEVTPTPLPAPPNRG